MAGARVRTAEGMPAVECVHARMVFGVELEPLSADIF